jgi:hypothetical protein
VASDLAVMVGRYEVRRIAIFVEIRMIVLGGR